MDNHDPAMQTASRVVLWSEEQQEFEVGAISSDSVACAKRYQPVELNCRSKYSDGSCGVPPRYGKEARTVKGHSLKLDEQEMLICFDARLSKRSAPKTHARLSRMPPNKPGNGSMMACMNQAHWFLWTSQFYWIFR